MVLIYVLGLEQGKYYIGETNNFNNRIYDHFEGNRSAWTKKYKPIIVIETIDNQDDYDEDKYTLIYMNKYRIDKCSWLVIYSDFLDDSTKNFINMILKSTNNNCFKCGETGHFVKNCLNKIKCKRCGRTSHNVDKCYAKKDVNGVTINYITKKNIK